MEEAVHMSPFNSLSKIYIVRNELLIFGFQNNNDGMNLQCRIIRDLWKRPGPDLNRDFRDLRYPKEDSKNTWRFLGYRSNSPEELLKTIESWVPGGEYIHPVNVIYIDKSELQHPLY